MKKAPPAEARDAFRDPLKGSRSRPRVGTAAKPVVQRQRVLLRSIARPSSAPPAAPISSPVVPLERRQ